MSGYLNVEAIENASDLINTTLMSKGYITQKLKFPVIDWKELIADQPHKDELEKLQIAENLYNNDKNVINIIYSLSQTIDRHHAQHKTFNKALSQKEDTIAELRRKIQGLELQVDKYESKLDKEQQRDQKILETTVRELTKTNRVQAKEVARLKGWTTELQTKYDVEIRKKALEVSQLKDKLLDSRNLSTSITYGKPAEVVVPTHGAAPEINPSLVHYNKPLTNNSAVSEVRVDEKALASVLNQEYEGIATQLSELIENLIKENSKYANFVNEMNDYFKKFNAHLSFLNHNMISVASLTNPSDIIDMERIESKSAAEIDPFDFVSKPLLSSIYKNYHYVAGLVDIVANAGSYKAQGSEALTTIEQLRDENKVLYKNWQEAMKLVEDLKKFKQT